MFYEHNGIKVETNNKNLIGIPLIVDKLSNILISNKMVHEEVTMN